MRVCCIKECKNKAIVKRDKLTNCDEEEKEIVELLKSFNLCIRL